MSQPTTIAALAAIVDRLRTDGKTVVHAQGVFDLLHRKHIERLEAARRHGDVLVVTIPSDAELETAGVRCVVAERLRAETVAALDCVDVVAVETGTAGLDVFAAVRPHVSVIGVDGPFLAAGKPVPDSRVRDAIARVDGRTVVMEDAAVLRQEDRGGISASPEADAFLRRFRESYSADQVIEQLESLRDLKVLVVGDTIIDEYHFVRPYGMPLKSPIIAAQFLNGESHAGGVLAVANHLAGFCGEVHLVTCLGGMDPREAFIRSNLDPRVSARCFVRPDATTTIKRRYLRKFLVQKLFEVSFFNDSPLPGDLDTEVCSYLTSMVPECDVVLVSDFGQGFITYNMIEVICRTAKFLAVNTQLNSVNYGYNVITKYPRADYICIDEDETRMACRDRTSPVEELVEQLARELGCQTATITRGHHGSTTWKPEGEQFTVPVLCREVVDTIGAGDAYLSVTTPCAAMGFAPDLLGFIGNAVGGLAVRIIGNREPVRPEPLFDLIRSLLR